MSSLTSSAVRWDVILRLQQQLQGLPPGSEIAEIIEHSLSLATSPRRAVTDAPLFSYDLRRNARHIVRRGAKRRANLLQRMAANGGPGVAGIDRHTPEAICVANDLMQRIRLAVHELGFCAIRCFDGMLAEEPIHVTAAACRVSARTVKRFRRQIRALARQVLWQKCDLAAPRSDSPGS